MDSGVITAISGLAGGAIAAILTWQVNARRAATDDRTAKNTITVSSESAAVANASAAVNAQQSVVVSLLAENGRLRMQTDAHSTAIAELQKTVTQLQAANEELHRENVTLRSRVAGLEATRREATQ